VSASPELIFEHPLNERIRTFLRLEHLFERAEHFLPVATPWETRAAVEALLDVIAITARADIKTELLKEIDRNLSTLARIRNQPGVDPGALNQVIDDLEQAAGGIHALPGQIGAEAREDEFLKAIAQRNSIPGGACSFDLPFYHHFLTQPQETRRARLDDWMSGLTAVSQAVRLVLSLARTSATPRQRTAEDGFYQESLDSQAPAQLVRVGLDPTLAVFPEISGHKNRFSIRFLAAEPGRRPAQSRDDVEFRLTCCVF
jgi:cell division protein ZapD